MKSSMLISCIKKKSNENLHGLHEWSIPNIINKYLLNTSNSQSCIHSNFQFNFVLYDSIWNLLIIHRINSSAYEYAYLLTLLLITFQVLLCVFCLRSACASLWNTFHEQNISFILYFQDILQLWKIWLLNYFIIVTI